MKRRYLPCAVVAALSQCTALIAIAQDSVPKASASFRVTCEWNQSVKPGAPVFFGSKQVGSIRAINARGKTYDVQVQFSIALKEIRNDEGVGLVSDSDANLVTGPESWVVMNPGGNESLLANGGTIAFAACWRSSDPHAPARPQVFDASQCLKSRTVNQGGEVRVFFNSCDRPIAAVLVGCNPQHSGCAPAAEELEDHQWLTESQLLVRAGSPGPTTLVRNAQYGDEGQEVAAFKVQTVGISPDYHWEYGACYVPSEMAIAFSKESRRFESQKAYAEFNQKLRAVDPCIAFADRVMKKGIDTSSQNFEKDKSDRHPYGKAYGPSLQWVVNELAR